MKIWLASGLCGAFGGMAPSLLEFAGLAKFERWPGVGFYVMMVIFAVLGGAVAVIYKEEKTHKAFLLGVSTPALIVAVGGVADDHAAAALEAQNNTAWLPALVSVAHAQPAPPHEAPDTSGTAVPDGQPQADAAATTTARILKVELPREETAFSVAFFDKAKAKQAPLQKHSASGRTFDVEIPNGAAFVMVTSPSFHTGRIRLPADQKEIKLVVQKNATFWSGVLHALGMENRAKRAHEIEATIAP